MDSSGVWTQVKNWIKEDAVLFTEFIPLVCSGSSTPVPENYFRVIATTCFVGKRKLQFCDLDIGFIFSLVKWMANYVLFWMIFLLILINFLQLFWPEENMKKDIYTAYWTFKIFIYLNYLKLVEYLKYKYF